MTFAASRGSRAVALAVLALLLALLWLGPVSLYLEMVCGGAEQLAQRGALLKRYEALARAPPPETPPPAKSPDLFPAVPEAQAVAMLQETIKAAAAANHIEVRSLQVLRNDAVADTGRIGVRVRAVGDVASLGRLLYAVESAQPALYPDNLQIIAPPAAPLDFQLDVTGFRSGGAS
jgi:hypothetical protein